MRHLSNSISSDIIKTTSSRVRRISVMWGCSRVLFVGRGRRRRRGGRLGAGITGQQAGEQARRWGRLRALPRHIVGDFVAAAVTPRVAAQDAPAREAGADDGAMLF